MKRIFFGIVWFFVFSLAGLVVGGAIVGASAGIQVDAATLSEGYEKGAQAGEAAGAEFGQQYGGLVLLGALALSIVGTAAGVLPGTARKRSE